MLIIPDGSFKEYENDCPHCGFPYPSYKRNGPHIEIFCTECQKHIGFTKQWNESNWKQEIKQKANYICEKCGKHMNPKEAKAHHKVPKWFKPEWQYEISNGMCLCHECHRAIHGGDWKTIKESED